MSQRWIETADGESGFASHGIIAAPRMFPRFTTPRFVHPVKTVRVRYEPRWWRRFVVWRYRPACAGNTRMGWVGEKIFVSREPAGFSLGVVVQKNNPFTTRCPQHEIARMAQARLRFMEYCHARIGKGKFG